MQMAAVLPERMMLDEETGQPDQTTGITLSEGGKLARV
jgi:hypothetical protein